MLLIHNLEGGPMETIDVRYRFNLGVGALEVFDLRFRAGDMELLDPPPEENPSWARLAFHQCPHCPLTPDDMPDCPLALRLVDLLRRFDRIMSYDTVRLDVTTRERFISQDTTAQRGISSLLGLLIATSGCPHTRFLRPMARHHLPFASYEETLYRAASMYALAQFFRLKAGLAPDTALQGLIGHYDAVRQINLSVVERVREATRADSAVNALVILDFFAQVLPESIDEELEKLRGYFTAYLEG
jgi:hypothetical protein